MAKITPFKAEQFVGTEHYTAKQKAEFGNRLATFVVNGFKPHDFTDILYKGLSSCYGHIAHHNREGFYGVWFSSPQKQAEFIKHTLKQKVHGDPKYTFCDVEVAFQNWLRDQNIQVKVEAKADDAKVYVALADIADHALTIFSVDKTAETVATVVDQSVAFVGKFVLEALDPARVDALKAALVRKYTVNAIEFRLADLSKEANSFGHHGHIFVAQDGETWSVTAYRGGGIGSHAIKIGASVTVPLVNGVLSWGKLGYEVPEKLGKARPDQVEKVWVKPWEDK